MTFFAKHEINPWTELKTFAGMVISNLLLHKLAENAQAEPKTHIHMNPRPLTCLYLFPEPSSPIRTPIYPQINNALSP